MRIDEADRLHLYEVARHAWVDEGAARTLMNLLPPDRDELATKSDIVGVGLALRSEMQEVRADLLGRMNTLLVAMVGMWITLVALLAAARFA